MKKKKWASTNINGVFHHGRSRILLAALLVAMAMAYTPVARAGGIVSSCDEASLLTAVSGGGTVTFKCSGTITLTATITILADTTIDGTGQNVTVSGGDAVQVLIVPAGVKLSLKKIIIANGSSISVGGGTFNQGALTVTSVTFSGNKAFGGGGIFNDYQATLNLSNSTFIGNSEYSGSYYGGGGILNNGTLTVTDSTFTGNSAYSGGGIENGYSATLNLSNSTLAGNIAQSDGGGLSNSQATLIVTNSTFSGNSAGYYGGGVFSGVPSASWPSVSNSTLFGNSAQFGGGGIWDVFGVLTLRNTILANSLSGGDCAPSRIDGGGNLDTDGTCGGTTSDPFLGPLQNNGGPTQTMAISMASPAFAGANPANCPATDQRGVLRPQFLSCDIGAYEFDTANSLLTAVRKQYPHFDSHGKPTRSDDIDRSCIGFGRRTQFAQLAGD